MIAQVCAATIGMLGAILVWALLCLRARQPQRQAWESFPAKCNYCGNQWRQVQEAGGKLGRITCPACTFDNGIYDEGGNHGQA